MISEKDLNLVRKLIVTVIAMLCCMTATGCEGTAEKPDTMDKLSEDQAAIYEESAGKEKPHKSEEQEKENIDKDNTENKKESEDAEITEAECIDKINLLKDTKAVHLIQGNILADIARCVTVSGILDEKGMVFSEMDNYKKAALRRQVINAVMWGESVLRDAIPVIPCEDRNDADSLIPVENAEELFKEIYGEEVFTPAEYEHIDDGYILISYGDGDPWHTVDHMQFFEDDDFLLLTGPAFYEDNGGCISFLGYADILFRKNPESRYGVTILYGRYRDEKINVTSVTTSSQLPDAAGRSYSGMNLVDGDYTTIWSEGVMGTGIGETITLNLDKIQLVYGVTICNGYTADYDLYANNGKLTEAEVDFGNGYLARGSLGGFAFEGYSSEDLVYTNQNRIELDEPVMTDTVIIKILGAESGAKYDDTCVSEIRVY
ncbi:MAG: hypothetical protein K6F35_10820 [Lachnospiraceae bacterium]|nr:hypothetical protein [Lachnospiraceae bacterium]